MGERICSVEGCGRTVKARGWCTAHYELWRRNGTPEKVRVPGYRAKAKPRLRPRWAGVACSVAGCESPARAKALCNKHYLRSRTRPDGSLADPTRGPSVCTIEECDGAVHTAGLCGKHYRRWSRNGTTDRVKGSRMCGVEWCTRPHFGHGWCALHYDRWREFGNALHRLPRDIIEGTRMCTRCRRIADLADFGVDRSTKSGLSIYCGDCANELGHLRRVALAAGIRAAGRVSRREVFDRDQWTCGLCGQSIDRSIPWPESGSPSIDHRIPIKLGGQHVLTNLQAAHLGCNLSKGARLIA